MKSKKYVLLSVLTTMTAIFSLYSAEPGKTERVIRLLQDDGQIRMASKLYQLHHLRATEIRPFIEAAIKRYSASSRIERVNYNKAGKQYILVSTGEDFIPYVDDLVKGLDQPGKLGPTGSLIEGTGITRITYTPNYRAAEDIVRIINGALKSGEGIAYLNKDTNMIYWKDDYQAAMATLTWVKYLDRPLPQANIRVNYYEIRESKLRDIGLDYLAWKNGPGLDILSVGFNGGKIFSDESVRQIIQGLSKLTAITRDFSLSWGYGGFFTAPYFDMSFIRLLQQSGCAKLSASANITFVNTPIYDIQSMNQGLPKVYTAALTPGYENIVKDSNNNDKTSIVSSDESELVLSIFNPVICFGAEASERNARGEIPATKEFYRKDNKGSVIFSYTLDSKTVTERSNQGHELGNTSSVSSEITLGFKTEKLLASYVRDQDVKQVVGIPFLKDIPILKYLFSTTTTIKEKTCILVTVESELIHPDARTSASDKQ